jgi:hypothetical protein
VTPQSIPMTAWEQAAIVALFAAFVIALIVVLLNQFGKQQKENQAYIAAQQKQVQEYLDKRDAQYQGFLREERKAVNDSRKEDIEKISQLTTVIDHLMKMIESRLDEMMVTVTKYGGEERRNRPRNGL